MCMVCCYILQFGMKRVHVVLSGLHMKLLTFVHVRNACRHGYMYVLLRFSGVCR